MSTNPTTIRLFLVEGSSEGLIVAGKSNWTGVALAAPRTRYGSLRARQEMAGAGVYVLVGPAEGADRQSRVYIGQGEKLGGRLDHHQSNRDFWTSAVVFTALGGSLNNAHVRYLEAKLIQLARTCRRAELDNSANPEPVSLGEAEQADMESFLADMLQIYPILGVHAFDPIVGSVEAAGPAGTTTVNSDLFLRVSGTDARGRLTAEGMLVFAGATGKKDVSEFLPSAPRGVREGLLRSGVLVEDEGGRVRLTEDQLFNSPSSAAGVLIGRSSNGNLEWKTAEGRSLGDLRGDGLSPELHGPVEEYDSQEPVATEFPEAPPTPV